MHSWFVIFSQHVFWESSSANKVQTKFWRVWSVNSSQDFLSQRHICWSCMHSFVEIPRHQFYCHAGSVRLVFLSPRKYRAAPIHLSNSKSKDLLLVPHFWHTNCAWSRIRYKSSCNVIYYMLHIICWQWNNIRILGFLYAWRTSSLFMKSIAFFTSKGHS